jgi:hypothetical protein
MERKQLKIKEWIIDREQSNATRYNVFMDFERDDVTGTRKVTDGFLTVTVTVLSETEKAIRINIESGLVVGSSTGWTTWVPKSQIKEVA